METKNYLDDLKEIKEIMNKSSRFLSLSGLSGILAGVYALIGSAVAYYFIEDYLSNYQYKPLSVIELEIKLIVVAIIVVFASIITGVGMSYNKASKTGESIWDYSSKRLVLNFAIPLVTGGILVLILLSRGLISMIAPTTLLFYGMACINASKYTLGDVRYLGITITAIGLLSAYFIGFGLFFWALGFGVCHIIYGAMMYFKYDRK